jgi:hypothetical protein
MGNNSGVSNLPFALSATASLTLLGIPGLQTSGITGNLTLSKTGTTARTQTARDASGNLCLDSVNNGFTVSQSIDRGTGALPAPINAAAQCLTLANVNAATCNVESFGFGATGANIRARISGGTRSVPTAVTDGQIFFNLPNGGYDGTAWQIDSIFYRTVADGLWSGTNRGAYHLWACTPNGGTIPAECMRLQNGCQTLGGIAAVSGNGLIQTASGTTKANGWALSTDLFFFRLSSGFASLQTSGVAPTDRHGLSLAGGGYSAPGAHLSDADGDKLVIYNGDNQHSVIGQGNTSNFWFKSTNGTTGGSFEWYTGTAGVTLRLTLNATGLVGTGAVLSSSSTAGVGYSTGAGGTVTQITSRTTGVTLNKITGAITLVSAAGSVAWQSFTVTNSAVAATDTIICNQVSGTDLNMIHVTAIAAGSFRISFATTAGVTVEQPVFRFTVIKSVSA